MSSSYNEQNSEFQQKKTSVTSKLIDLSLTFGDDGGQQDLLNIKVNVCSCISTNIQQMHTELLKQIQSKESQNKDILIVIKFEVESGREREAVEFIEKGLDQDESNENTSAMQKLFHRPKVTGRIELKEGKGFIYAIYRFYEEQLQITMENIVNAENAKLDANFSIEATVKGTIQGSKRSFTALKPDYFKLKIVSEKLPMSEFLEFMKSTKGQNPDLENQAIYKLIKNLEIVKMDLKFDSIRQIMRYYNRILYEDQKQDQDQKSKHRQLPLLNKGIFKNCVSTKTIISNKIALQAEAKYKSEEVMLRLVARFTKIWGGN